jgi:hypothetical protein
VVLEHLLSEKRTSILKRWFELIVDTYPADVSQFLMQEMDRFLNPVGFTISREIIALYDGLLQGQETEKLAGPLDNIVKIRAVQDFSPKEAVSFVLSLKKVLREELEDHLWKNQFSVDLLEFESKIDDLALLAMETYIKYREKIQEIKLKKQRAEKESVLKLNKMADQRTIDRERGRK